MIVILDRNCHDNDRITTVSGISVLYITDISIFRKSGKKDENAMTCDVDHVDQFLKGND